MTKKPFFSIIIPVYNRQDTIKRAISSCLNQTFSDFEIIIVNDKSTDESEVAIQSFSDSRIKYICNKVNSERCFSRNVGINEAKADFICFLDSDDYFLENHLSFFHEKIQEMNVKSALLFTNSFVENEQNEKTKKIVPNIGDYDSISYLLQYTPNPARVCISKNILNVLKFDERLPGLEDLDLWLRIAAKHRIIQFMEYTNVYYVHSESYSSGDPLRFEKELSYHEVMKNQPELINKLPKKGINRLSSMCHFHIAQKCIYTKKRTKFYNHAFKSFYLYPKGYNGRTNKILFVNALYFIPVIGVLCKSVVAFIKKQ